MKVSLWAAEYQCPDPCNTMTTVYPVSPIPNKTEMWDSCGGLDPSQGDTHPPSTLQEQSLSCNLPQEVSLKGCHQEHFSMLLCSSYPLAFISPLSLEKGHSGEHWWKINLAKISIFCHQPQWGVSARERTPFRHCQLSTWPLVYPDSSRGYHSS